MNFPTGYNILCGNWLHPFVSKCACLPLSHHRNAGVGVERNPSDGKDLWRSAVHYGPAMCRGGALCATVSCICHHLPLCPTETPNMFSRNMVTLHPWTPSLLPPLPSPHSTSLHLTNITLWLITAKIHWLIFHYKFPVWIQTATLICCLTLSTHKPWSTMSSLRLVCTRICWYVCMHACICVPISHKYKVSYCTNCLSRWAAFPWCWSQAVGCRTAEGVPAAGPWHGWNRAWGWRFGGPLCTGALCPPPLGSWIGCLQWCAKPRSAGFPCHKQETTTQGRLWFVSMLSAALSQTHSSVVKFVNNWFICQRLIQ